MGARFLLGVKVPKLMVVMSAEICEYTTNHGTVHSMWMNCMVFESYLSKLIDQKKNAF